MEDRMMGTAERVPSMVSFSFFVLGLVMLFQGFQLYDVSGECHSLIFLVSVCLVSQFFIIFAWPSLLAAAAYLKYLPGIVYDTACEEICELFRW